eukprot:gene503-8017_t
MNYYKLIGALSISLPAIGYMFLREDQKPREKKELKNKNKSYVGIRNEGATCYLNSLLQNLFHIPYFRQEIFDIICDETEEGESLTLELQRFFYHLECKEDISTTSLMKSFGWDSSDAFVQHDIHELTRILLDELSDKIDLNVFKGCLIHKIECLKSSYQSNSIENFYDIQLPIKNCKTIGESLKEYTKKAFLTGDNQYDTGNGKEDATKYCLFKTLPPILMFHLERFSFSYYTNTMSKINDYYKYDQEIDLKNFVDKSEENQDTTYVLTSVIVHQGSSTTSGHYYTYIDVGDDNWMKFNDEKVYSCNSSEALGHLEGISTAYVLFYIQKSQMEKIKKSKIRIPEILRDKFDSDDLCNIL